MYRYLDVVLADCADFFLKKSAKKFVSLKNGSTFASANENAPYLNARR